MDTKNVSIIPHSPGKPHN